MKNDDTHDPLNENEFEEQKPGPPNKKHLKEGNEHLQSLEVQEQVPRDPGDNGVSRPHPDPTAQPEQQSAPDQEIQSEQQSTPDQEIQSEQQSTPDQEIQSEQQSAPDQEIQSEQQSEQKPESHNRTGSRKEPGKVTGIPAGKPEDSTAKPGKGSGVDHGRLIDDEEEQLKNASFDHEAYDEEEEEESLAHSHEEAPEMSEEVEEEEERGHFSLLSMEDLVKLMREKLDNPAKGNIRKDVAEIKQAFYDKVNTSLEEKKEHFLAEGGNLEDFKPLDDPLEVEMKDLLHKYRELKAEFSRQLESTKQENLQKKQEILEQFRILMEGQERFETTFRKFKDLQKQWFGAGIVPQQNLKDLWDSYNYFVEKFNDYVRINRELRALDLKKNLELKIQLCERTEELDKDPNVVQAFRTLQKYHSRWREIGPVPRENRDEIWDRFKQATSVINRKHQDYHTKLKESLQENLAQKRELCEQVENIAEMIFSNHRDWVDKTGQVLEIQKTWKTIGYAPKKDNNAIYARFRRACDTFFGNKARFYAGVYEEQKENLKLKTEITEKAEALVNSEDWKETTNELIRLQKQWKDIGPVPRRDSDKLWRRFRAACDAFFNNKSKYFEDVDSSFEDNLKAKQEIIREMGAYRPEGGKKKGLDVMEDFQSRFNNIGYVPSSKKELIKEQFRKAQDRLLQKIGLDESERSLFRFRNRIMGILNSPRSQMKLNFERDKLINKLQQLKNDIGVWENNIGFFKQSDSSEETIQGFNEKIEAAHERIHLLEEKIRLLDDMENEN